MNIFFYGTVKEKSIYLSERIALIWKNDQILLYDQTSQIHAPYASCRAKLRTDI